MQTGVLVSREISGVNTPGPEPWPQIEALLDTVPGVPERKQRLAAAQADPATLVHLCSLLSGFVENSVYSDEPFLVKQDQASKRLVSIARRETMPIQTHDAPRTDVPVDSGESTASQPYEAPKVEKLGDWQVVTLVQSIPIGP